MVDFSLIVVQPHTFSHIFFLMFYQRQQYKYEIVHLDERGIVMGEFGFITADGIYHVTVYATDEEGKFRILAMRSYPYEEHPSEYAKRMST